MSSQSYCMIQFPPLNIRRFLWSIWITSLDTKVEFYDFFFFIIILFSMISKPMESVLLIHPWLLFPANSVINPEQNVKFRFRLITEFGFWNDIWKVKEKTFEKQPSPLTPTPNWTCRPIAKDPGSQKIKKWTMHFSPAYGLIIQ